MFNNRLISYFSLVFILFCSFSLYSASRDASVVKLTEWGSHTYTDIAKAGGLLFLTQGNPHTFSGNSDILDVIDESIEGKESLVNKIQMPDEILAVDTFNGDLVVMGRGFLGIYSVDTENELTLEYEISTSTFLLDRNDKLISIHENKLAFLDNKANLHIIEFVRDKYQLFATFEADFLTPDTFYSLVVLGLETDKIYIGRKNNNTFLTSSYNYTDSTITYNEDEKSTNIPDDEHHEQYGTYVTEGKFVMSMNTSGQSTNSIVLISHNEAHTEVVKNLSNTFFCCHIDSEGQNVWVTDSQGSVRKYDVSDPTIIQEVASGKGAGITFEEVYVGRTKLIDGHLYILDRVNIIKLNSSTLNNREYLYNQAGPITGFVVDDDRIVVAKNNRLQILQQSSSTSAPTLLTQAKTHLVTTSNDAFGGSKLLKINDSRYLKMNPFDLTIIELNDDNTADIILNVNPGYMHNPLIHNDYLFILSGGTIKRYDVLKEGGLLGNYRLFDLNFDFEEYGDGNGYLKIVGEHIVFSSRRSDGRHYLSVVSNIYSEELIITDTIYVGGSTFHGHIDSKDEYVYWMGADSSLRTYSISGEGKLNLIHTLEEGVSNNPSSIDVSDEMLIATYNYDPVLFGLFSLADPAEPKFVSNRYILGVDNWGGGGYRKTVTTDQNVIYQSKESSGVLTLYQVNYAPKPLALNHIILEDSALVLNVQAQDPEGDLVYIRNLLQPGSGKIEVGENNVLTYTPGTNFFGQDSFSVELADTHGNFTELTEININVTPVNDPPMPLEIQYTGMEDESIFIGLSDLDPEGDEILADFSRLPQNGQLLFDSDNKQLIFSPNQDFYGEDSATVNLCDEQKECTKSSVVFLITPINDAPVVSDESFTLDENGSYVGKLNVEDVDDDSFSFNITQNSLNGTIDMDEPTGDFSYMPTSNFTGTDSVVYEVTDGLGATGSATITFTIKALPLIGQPQSEVSSGGGGSLSGQYLILLIFNLALVRFKVLNRHL
jgi:hypothetical protein